MKAMLTCARAVSLAGLVAAAGCAPVDAPDQNAQALSGLTTSASVAAVKTAAQGLIKGMRGDAVGVAESFGILGREGYNLDPGNPQTEQAYYTNLADIALWAGPYTTIKLADLVMQPLDGVVGLTAAEREGVRGFAKTVKAIELLNVIRCTDVGGAALDATANATDPPPPIAAKADVYAQILKLLDEAATHLNAAGDAFVFGLGDGFAGFDTPSTFLQFNRAIRARANIDTKNFAAALTDLGGSFLDTGKPLTLGVYHTYSTVSGDVINRLFEGIPRLYFTHPSIANNAQLKPDGTRDNRFLAKVTAVPTFTRFNITAQWTWKIYTSNTSPIPFVRNEELILLRAEANLGLGNTALAIADINFVRAQSGGLAPITNPYVPTAGQPATLLDELLYEKRYSLMWEAGPTWLDARHYGKLAALPHDLTGHVVYPYLRLPDLECNARNPQPAGCTQPVGL